MIRKDIKKRNTEESEFESCVLKEVAVLLEQGVKYKKYYRKDDRVWFVFDKTVLSNRVRKSFWEDDIFCKPRELIKYYKEVEGIINQLN